MIKEMFRFGSVLLASVLTLMIKVFGFLFQYGSRLKSGGAEEKGSNFSANPSQKDDDNVTYRNPTGFLSRRVVGDSSRSVGDTEKGSVLLQSGGLIADSSECECVSGKDASGCSEEPKTERSVVRGRLVGSSEIVVGSDQTPLGCEIPQDSLELKLEKHLQESDDGSGSNSFCFNLFSASCSANEGIQGCMSELENIGPKEADDHEKDSEEEERLKSNGLEDLDIEGMDSVKDEILEEHDVACGIELLPPGKFSTPVADQEPDAAGNANEMLIGNEKTADEAVHEGNECENWMRSFLEETDLRKPGDLEEEHLIRHSQGVYDLDDEYIELEPIREEVIPFEDANKVEELYEQDIERREEVTLLDGSQELNGDDEDEQDVLLEHQHLVQQMKVELKNCRISGLPTISEECETPKMVEDLKPLKIDHKVEYKDMMEEIQKFYKSYAEKMRKLDILNYQTLHAISFLQLKVSEVFTAGRKMDDSAPFVLSKVWPCKVQRIHADPIHKSIIEMHCDLELVYVGQLCLSWEILCWLYVKTQELLDYDPKGNNHSYNRAAEEFQQFQVLVQRFVEDEQFQGQRTQNYVRSRCMIRSLLQVPTVRDDCLKAKKERTNESDSISLQMLVEIIWESMLIFREFLLVDKRSANVALKGIRGNKINLQGHADSELLLDIFTNLHKKERRIRENIRSQNCIVKKLKRQQECREVLTSQVELRLVSAVLSLSRITADQLVWCQKKLESINFVSSKVHVEPSLLLFPC